jgi:hypothetical protein
VPGRQYKITFAEHQFTECDTGRLLTMDYSADDDVEDVELFNIAELGGVAEDEFDVAAQRVSSTAEGEIDLASMDTLLFDEYETESEEEDSIHVRKIHRSESEDLSSLGSLASCRSLSDSGAITPSPIAELGNNRSAVHSMIPAEFVKLEEFSSDFDAHDEYAIDLIKLESYLDTTVNGNRRKRRAKKAIRDFHEV